MEELSPLKVLNNSAAETARNLSRPVMLVGFLAQANLGLGYLASRLRERGYRVQIVDFEQDPTRILEIAQSLNSVLIGFSLIFQFYIERFLSLIVSLRNSGITCH